MAKKAKKAKPKAPARRAPARKPASRKSPAARPAEKFDPKTAFGQAVALAAGGFLLDAKAKFAELVAKAPKADLADDALYNAGLCSFQLGLYEDALSLFSRVASEYPRATIHAVAGAQESGRTAAKAHLGRLKTFLALGRRDDAQRELDALNQFPDSYALTLQGQKRTYYELGIEALESSR